MMTVFWDVAPNGLVHTDISEELNASIIRVNHGATSQKTEVFILVAMRISNFTCIWCLFQ
jgi:hypothetical protein